MIFKSFYEANGWVTVDYKTTWKYGYDLMLDAGQLLIDEEFGRQTVQKIATAPLANSMETYHMDMILRYGYSLRTYPLTAKENGQLAIAGVSKTLKIPVQVTFYNGTDVCRFYSPAVDYFKQNGQHALDNYANSIEILAYSKNAQRQLMERFGKNKA